MWSRRSIWLVVAAAAVAVLSFNWLGAIGGRNDPPGETRRMIATHLHYDLAEFNALGGEPVPENADLYETCAAPAECHCWAGPQAETSTRRDDSARDRRSSNKDAAACRVLRPWWARLWRTVSP